jgi:hypothetical protein
MAGLFLQPEGLFKVTFDIFGIRDRRRKQAPGMDGDQNVPFTANLSWTLQKRMSVHLYTSSHFPLTAYRTYISHLGHSHITLRDRACLHLLNSWGQELLWFSGYGRDGHPHGVVPKDARFHQVQRKSPDQHFSLFDPQFTEVGGSGR